MKEHPIRIAIDKDQINRYALFPRMVLDREEAKVQRLRGASLKKIRIGRPD
jgi:hypothetical protein